MVLLQTSRFAPETLVPISFTVLIVVYGMPPSETRTFQTLSRCDDLASCDRVIVLDHSPQPQHGHVGTQSAALVDRLRYLHDPANPPLGVAYNRIVARELEDSTYLVLFDQDTELPRDFLTVCREVATRTGEPTALMPMIDSAGRLASPCWSALGWGIAWKAPRTGRHAWRWCSAITSGSVIHRRAFTTYALRYSEDLRFYGIDTDFFRRLGQQAPHFEVLPLVMRHSLSFDEASTEGKARKLDQVLAANRRIFADSGWGRLGVVAALEWALRLKYVLRYRNTTFLRRRSGKIVDA